MNAPMQLPAHLQGRQATGMTSRAAEGMGSSMPPHISISGNKFTFFDASGNEAPPMLTFDAYVIDVSDHMNKRYYDKPYDMTATTYEPPACWSSNGIGPSREATKPQSPTCELCPQNMRGSQVSKMSGALIKACRDEKWIAIINPAFGNMVFQLVVTPGSFKNWKAFIAQLENYKVDPHWVITRFSFEDKVNGVLQFTMLNWTPPEHLPVIDAALAEKKTDAIVGRLDVVRQGLLPAPSQQGTTLPPNNFAPPANTGFAPTQQPMAMVQQPQRDFQHPQGQQEIIPPGAAPQAPFGQQMGVQLAAAGPAPTAFGQSPSPSAGSISQFPTANPAGGAAIASPSEQPQPTQRRRRNSAAAAAPAQNGAGAAPQGQQTAFQPTAPAPQAPFGAAPTAAAPSMQMGGQQAAPGGFPSGAAPASGSPSNNFGIGGGAPMQANPEMSAMLGSLFPNAAPR